MHTILIHLRKMGFVFLVDTNYKYNLIEPCLLKFFKGMVKATPPEKRMPKEEYDAIWQEKPFEAPVYYDEDLYTCMGYKFIWEKWKPRILKRIKLNFEYEGKPHSETFLVDKSLCSMPPVDGAKITGILTKDFIIKK